MYIVRKIQCINVLLEYFKHALKIKIIIIEQHTIQSLKQSHSYLNILEREEHK